MTMRVAARDDVVLMSGYHSPQLDVDVRLNTNESPFPPPPGFGERLAAELSTVDWNRYPDREAQRLRSAIGAHHGVPSGQVFAANGSNEVLQTLLLAYGGSGRTAAVFEPTYALHSHLSRVTGTELAVGERGDRFELDIDVVVNLLSREKPAVTFLCSPNNPTGSVDSPEALAAVLEVVADIGGLLCVDEAYAQFAKHTALDLMGDDVPLAVSRTYSKTWAMAAARLGYLLAPEQVVDDLGKVVLPYHLDAVTQLSGTVALEFEDAMHRRADELVEERTRLMRALTKMAVETWSSEANFVLFRPLDRPGDDVWQALVNRSVLVRNCASWPRLEGCLRVTVGTPAENDRFLDALQEVL